MDVEALYRTHAPALLAFLTARLPGRAAAEDLHHAVWVRALAQPRELAGDHPRRWLFTLAKNLLPASADPDDRLAALRKGVGRLAPDDRAAVEARFAGESAAEAAARLGVPPALVDTRYRQATDRLRAGDTTWTVTTIPDDPAALPGWLEARLVGFDLGRLAAELRAVHPPRTPPLRLDEVLGSAAGVVFRGGLGGLPQAALRKLLRNPDLLLELQELALIEGGRYWADLPAGGDLGRAADRGWERVRRAAAAEPVRPAPAPPPAPPSRTAGRFLPYALTSLVTAAVVLGGVVVGLAGRRDDGRRASEAVLAEVEQLTRERDAARAAAEAAEARAKQPQTATAPAGWGWQRADAFPAAATRAEYLTALADRAEEWFQARPATPEDLARRLGEFRQGCSAVQLAAHAPLPERERDWLRERCRVWSQRIDEHLARVEETRNVDEARAAADATVRQLVTALRSRAAG